MKAENPLQTELGREPKILVTMNLLGNILACEKMNVVVKCTYGLTSPSDSGAAEMCHCVCQ